MNKYHFFMLLCHLVLVFPEARGKNDFKLVLVWPKAHCVAPRKCINPIPDAFIIHGLWLHKPSITPTKSLDTYSSSTLTQGILNGMKVHWPGLTMSDQILWEHEWNEHGVDTGLSVKDYFEKTVSAMKNLGTFEQALRNKGINPSDSVAYLTEDVGQIIKTSTGFKPELFCSGKSLLYRVIFYLDSNFEVKDAQLPKNKAKELFKSNNCGKTIYFIFLCHHVLTKNSNWIKKNLGL